MESLDEVSKGRAKAWMQSRDSRVGYVADHLGGVLQGATNTKVERTARTESVGVATVAATHCNANV